jgi:glucosamine kinase
MVFMGIDGGGTGVRVVVADADLVVLGQGEAGGVNSNVQPAAVAEGHLRTAIQQAITTARINPAHITTVTLGIAGTSYNDSSGDWMRRALTDLLPQARVIVSGDAEIALVGAHAAARGVIVIAGTGSVAYGINEQGRHARAGGYGWLLGDEGSGYWLGREAIAVVVQIFYEQGPATSLTEYVVAQLALGGADQIIQWVYANDTRKNTTIAALAPRVLQCAAEGDTAANSIVQRGALALAQVAKSILRQLDDPTLPIAFGGSVLTQSPLMSEQLRHHLNLATIPVPRYPPALGAVLLAVLQERS